MLSPIFVKCFGLERHSCLFTWIPWSEGRNLSNIHFIQTISLFSKSITFSSLLAVSVASKSFSSSEIEIMLESNLNGALEEKESSLGTPGTDRSFVLLALIYSILEFTIWWPITVVVNGYAVCAPGVRKSQFFQFARKSYIHQGDMTN